MPVHKPDEHYINFKLAQLYDFDSPWSKDRDYYLALAGEPPQHILDLGCGTGIMCEAYAARGHKVTGVDPAGAMLDVARHKPHGAEIEWVQSKAQDYKSEHLFDLIIMTGHAFQVLLEDKDMLATFAMMKGHLKPEGLIVFESRNYRIDWEKEWNYDLDLKTPFGEVHESRRFIKMEKDKMTFELEYKFPDETLKSQSVLRFWSKNEIENHLKSCGLFIEKIRGDWDDKPYYPDTSHEMIFKARSHR